MRGGMVGAVVATLLVVSLPISAGHAAPLYRAAARAWSPARSHG